MILPLPRKEHRNDLLPELPRHYFCMIAGFSWIEEGKVAGMRRPGSLHPLAEDLEKLSLIGVGGIVSLTEIALDESLAHQAGLTVLRVPIPDFHAPTLSDIQAIVQFIRQSNASNQPVVVHCTAGLGRTGTVLACWLVSQGMSPGNAIFAVRDKRPGSIETNEQEQVVFDYADSLSEQSV